MNSRNSENYTDKSFHVAIIMDGNGRWANSQGKPRFYGHRAGAVPCPAAGHDRRDVRRPEPAALNESREAAPPTGPADRTSVLPGIEPDQ